MMVEEGYLKKKKCTYVMMNNKRKTVNDELKENKFKLDLNVWSRGGYTN